MEIETDKEQRDEIKELIVQAEFALLDCIDSGKIVGDRDLVVAELKEEIVGLKDIGRALIEVQQTLIIAHATAMDESEAEIDRLNQIVGINEDNIQELERALDCAEDQIEGLRWGDD